MTTAIDLSQLPAPNVIEALDFESILVERKAYFVSLYPEEEQSAIAAKIELESDPINKLIQENVYRELVLRQRINDAAQSVMLTYASGSDLDQIGANYGVERLVLDTGDANAVPPVAATYEADSDFRRRIQLSLEGYTTAGSTESYIYHGLSADADVADIDPVSPTPGVVMVYVLSRTGDGTASESLLAKVAAALNAETVRPLTDQVSVLSASIVTYSIEAELVLYPGPDAEVVRAAAQAAIELYVETQRAMGRDVNLSGIYAALHQPGVQRVELASPTANLVIGNGEASYCTSISVTVAEGTDV